MEAVSHGSGGGLETGSAMPSKPVRVLLVEDDAADAYLATQALTAVKIPLAIERAGDGVEAIEKLGRSPLPDLILLDLNLPRMDGREVFRRLNANPDLAKIPVVVLTASDAERDATECLNLGAKGYFTKALGPEEFTRSVEELWLVLAKAARGD